MECFFLYQTLYISLEIFCFLSPMIFKKFTISLPTNWSQISNFHELVFFFIEIFSTSKTLPKKIKKKEDNFLQSFLHAIFPRWHYMWLFFNKTVIFILNLQFNCFALTAAYIDLFWPSWRGGIGTCSSPSLKLSCLDSKRRRRRLVKIYIYK